MYISTIGSDPEIFVVDIANKVIPAFKFLPSKEESDVYWDGWQAEWVTPPANSIGELINSVGKGMEAVLKSARTFDHNAHISPQCLMELTEKELQETEWDYVNFGCKPSQNIYKQFKPLNSHPREVPYRTSGFHVHFGLRESKRSYIYKFIHCIDAYILCPLTYLLRQIEHPDRRVLYGRPGEFRYTDYGIEYRSFSSSTLISPVLAEMVIDNCIAILSGNGLHQLPLQSDVCEHIMNPNSSNRATVAKGLANILRKTLGTVASEEFESVVNLGLKSYGINLDIERNWKL